MLFIKIRQPKKVDSHPKKVDSVPKKVDLYSFLYILLFTPYTRKIALKCDFSCTSANFVVPLQPQTKSLQTYFIKSVCFI